MRIAIITPGRLPVPPIKGGAVETLIYTLIKENDYSETPIHIDLYGIECDDIGVYTISQTYTNYIFQPIINSNNSLLFNTVKEKIKNKLNISTFLNKVIEQIGDKKYDYIVVQNRPNYVMKLKRKINSKIILHMHNEHLTTYKNYKDVISACDKIFVVSNYIKQTILNKYQVDDTKIIVLNNGINTDKFITLKEEDKLELKRKYNFKKDDFIVLFTGRLTKEKGIHELIKSFKYLKQYKNIKLLVIGAKWFSDNIKDDFTIQLEKDSQALKDRIIFTGYVDYNDVPQLYAIADLAVLPSIWNDPFPLSILECMSVGLPIITTYSGGIPEMINENCGIILPIDKNLEQSISLAITDLYYDITRRQSMADNSRVRAIQYFDNKIFYKNFIKHLMF